MKLSLGHVLTLASVALVGCGGATTGRTVQVEESRVIASTNGGETRVELVSPDLLFDDANAHLRAHECAEAVALYDQLVSEFASSRYVSPALYNSGLCLQDAEEWEASVARYERLLSMRPESTDVKHAMLQMADGLEHLERWQSALDNAEAALRRDDLSSAERLEALSRRARAVLGLGQLDEAARQAREAASYFRTRTGDEVIHDEYFAAMATYVLAETIRLRSEALAFPDGNVLAQHDVLDQRAQLLLQAQNAYFDAIRMTNAHWAAASGYRIGAMYRGFFDAITQAPVPAPPNPMNEAQLALYQESYRNQLRDRVRPLMRHAIRYWELTLAMVERTGVESEWTPRVREDLEATRSLMQADAQVRTATPNLDTPSGPP
jgi:tetratricopeptide (TPR) repeat protein